MLPVKVNTRLFSHVGEFTLGIKEMVVFIKTDAYGEAVNFNTLTGGSHDQIVGIREVLHCFRRNDDLFAVSGGPGLFLSEAAAIKRDGGIGRSRHDGKSNGEGKSIKTHFEIVRKILTVTRGGQISS